MPLTPPEVALRPVQVGEEPQLGRIPPVWNAIGTDLMGLSAKALADPLSADHGDEADELAASAGKRSLCPPIGMRWKHSLDLKPSSPRPF
jgi:hypothetical protein